MIESKLLTTHIHVNLVLWACIWLTYYLYTQRHNLQYTVAIIRRETMLLSSNLRKVISTAVALQAIRLLLYVIRLFGKTSWNLAWDVLRTRTRTSSTLWRCTTRPETFPVSFAQTCWIHQANMRMTYTLASPSDFKPYIRKKEIEVFVRGGIVVMSIFISLFAWKS